MIGNEDKVKESIIQLIENIDLTLCKTHIDWETNQIKIEFSAFFEGKSATDSIRDALKDIFLEYSEDGTTQLMTSGVTPVEIALMDERIKTHSGEKKRR